MQSQNNDHGNVNGQQPQGDDGRAFMINDSINNAFKGDVSSVHVPPNYDTSQVDPPAPPPAPPQPVNS